jgi:hypothetical protein
MITWIGISYSTCFRGVGLERGGGLGLNFAYVQ